MKITAKKICWDRPLVLWKRIYRVAVSRRLRNVALVHVFTAFYVDPFYETVYANYFKLCRAKLLSCNRQLQRDWVLEERESCTKTY